ncbi:MAG: hypothetical protein JNL87_05480 [Burkholderiaceae bacterium]|nr:hypothetical protein [Burkholderiaceae bacterium]
MSTANSLVQQHILECEARLKHIDELMSGLRQGSAEGPVFGDVGARMDRLRAHRDRFAVELEGLKSLPRGEGHQLAGRAERHGRVLEAIGLELEKALAAVIVPGRD